MTESNNTVSARMTNRMEKFLNAKDLDALLLAKQQIIAVTQEDQQAIRNILNQWSPSQGVANLLFHPSLIPEDIQWDTMVRALEDEDHRYLQLASVVGFQFIDSKLLSEQQRSMVRQRLIKIIQKNWDVLAGRASLTLIAYVERKHVDQMFEFLAHANRTVRHNVLSWIYEVERPRDTPAFVHLAKTHHVTDITLNLLLDELDENARRISEGKPDRLRNRLLAPIPNFIDFEQAT